MRIYVIEYLREDEQFQDTECFLNQRSARDRLKELERMSAPWLGEDAELFTLSPSGYLIDIPCNCEGLIAALEGRWMKYKVKDL